MDHCTRIADLCDEDKSKVAHLIRQLSKVNSDFKEVQAQRQADEVSKLKEIHDLNLKLMEVERENASLKKANDSLKKAIEARNTKISDLELEARCQVRYIQKLRGKMKEVTTTQETNAPTKRNRASIEKIAGSNEADISAFEIIQEEIKEHSLLLETESAMISINPSNLRPRIRVKVETAAIKLLKDMLFNARQTFEQQIINFESHDNIQKQNPNLALQVSRQAQKKEMEIQTEALKSSPRDHCRRNRDQEFLSGKGAKSRRFANSLYELIEEIDNDETFRKK